MDTNEKQLRLFDALPCAGRRNHRLRNTDRFWLHPAVVAVLVAVNISLAIYGVGSKAYGQDAAAAPAVAKLLESGWGPSLKSYEVARSAYQTAPRDSTMAAAMALVAIKHRRFDDAQGFLAQQIEANRADWAAQQNLLWVLLAKHDYETALIKIQELMLIVGEQPAGSDTLAQAQHLGRMFAFLEAPCEGELPDERLAKQQEQMLRAAPTAVGQAFQQGRIHLIVEFADALDAFEREEKVAAETRSRENQETQQTLAGEKGEVTGEVNELSAQLNEMKSEMETTLSKLDSELKPLSEQLQELQTKAAPKVAKLREINRDLDAIGAALASLDDGDGGKRGYLVGTGRRLQRERSEEERWLQPIMREGQEAEAKAASLWKQRIEATTKYERESKAVSRKLGILKRKQLQLGRAEERLSDDSPSAARRVREASVRALANYAPFDIDDKKTALLGTGSN